MRFLVLVLVLIAAAASAQQPSPTGNPKFDCSKTCTFVTDPYPSTGPLPINCRLYINGTFKAAAAPVNVSSPYAGSQCKVTISGLPNGTYNSTMSAVDSANQETAQSLPFVFDSAAPPAIPPPVNLRIQ